MSTLSGRDLIAIARHVIEREAEAVRALAGQFDAGLADVVRILLDCKGHVLVTGSGTSHAMAERFAHLLSCCGTPALCIDATVNWHSVVEWDLRGDGNLRGPVVASLCFCLVATDLVVEDPLEFAGGFAIETGQFSGQGASLLDVIEGQ